MTKLKHLKAVVFDWAGTTVDFGSVAPVSAVQEIFRLRGIEISLAQAREPMGRAKRDHLQAVTQMPAIATAWEQKFGHSCTEAEIDALYAEFLPLQEKIIREFSHVLPGIPEAIQALRDLGLKIGSTTGYTRHLMSIVAEQAAQQGYRPDCVLGAEDAPRGRPAPFLIYQAAIQLDVFPMWEIVNVDDTTVGVASGRNAGCWSIGVSRTGSCVGLTEQGFASHSPQEQKALLQQAEQSLTAAGAHYVIESVSEILPIIHAIEAKMARGERP